MFPPTHPTAGKPQGPPGHPGARLFVGCLERGVRTGWPMSPPALGKLLPAPRGGSPPEPPAGSIPHPLGPALPWVGRAAPLPPAPVGAPLRQARGWGTGTGAGRERASAGSSKGWTARLAPFLRLSQQQFASQALEGRVCRGDTPSACVNGGGGRGEGREQATDIRALCTFQSRCPVQPPPPGDAASRQQSERGRARAPRCSSSGCQRPTLPARPEPQLVPAARRGDADS